MKPTRAIQTSLELTFLVLGGLLLVALFYTSATEIALPGFRVPQRYYDADMRRLGSLFILMCGSYALIIPMVTFLKHWSERMILTVLLGIFSLMAICAVWSHPTGSQDIYWSLLLAKGLSQYQQNPYQTSPAQLSFDDWSGTVEMWRDLPMIYGPLWVVVLTGITALGLSLGGTLIVVKLVSLTLLIGLGWIFWKIMILHNFTKLRRYQLLLLLAWNPVIFQLFIVDVHNDIFTLFGILLSYYFLLKRGYAWSIAALLVVGLVKYIPWFIIPVPLFFWMKAQSTWPRKLWVVFGTGCASIVFIFLAYAPFGFSLLNLAGITNEFSQRGTEVSAIYLAYLLEYGIHLSISQIRLISLAAGLIAMGWSLKRGKILLGYTLPYIAILLFTTWFQPWYLLWIFPLLALYVPTPLMFALTVFMLLTPTVSTQLETSKLLLTFTGGYLLATWLSRRFFTPISKYDTIVPDGGD